MKGRYIVWYWQSGVLQRYPFGSNEYSAWRYLASVYELGYMPWLEWERR